MESLSKDPVGKARKFLSVPSYMLLGLPPLAHILLQKIKVGGTLDYFRI